MAPSKKNNQFWYKDGIIYQVHVKAFRDSNQDGIGDFGGLIEKLDYIQSLGVSILWVLPFYPSPMKDDGYDISDYYDINPDYGTLEDFKKLLREAHKRGIKVITELVLNHTSDQHEWFKRARFAKPGSPERDYYVWSDTADKYKDARIIFSDFETSNWSWDPVAKAYYWHRFYSHQPDLNFDNPTVRQALLRVVDYWLEMGVDGLRLDAVPYLYEREGTNCENLPETHEFLKKLSNHVQTKFKNKMLLAEANQWPEDAVVYFGNGDECQMAFHFPLMPRLYISVLMEDRFPIIDIMEQTPPIPENCQWAMFLRNHDELTLEMVTDEERDYMYRYYARDSRARVNLGIRRRLAPLIENNRRKIELMNVLLFSFPGTPIIYYGDEIGMGDNYYLGDRNGVRTPMQWSPDRNAGFSAANPQKLFLPVIIDPEYNYEAVNVEVHQRNSSSLLSWMKRAIAIRKNYKAFGRGSLEFLSPNNPKVLAFVREYEDQKILIVANLSRFSQVVELDLTDCAGYTPIEVFSKNKFPVIQETYYMLTLNAYDYYWFSLEQQQERIGTAKTEREIPEIEIKKDWKKIFENENKDFLEEEILPSYLNCCDWFTGKDSKIQKVELIEDIFLSNNSAILMIIRVIYIDKPIEYYLIPAAVSSLEKAKTILRDCPNGIILQIKISESIYALYEGVYDEEFRDEIYKSFYSKKLLKGEHGELRLEREKNKFKSSFNDEIPSSNFTVQDDFSIDILYENSLAIKLYRKTEEGVNPAVEVLKELAQTSYELNVPKLLSTIYYDEPFTFSITLGIIKEYQQTQSTAWNYFSDSLNRYLDNVIAKNDGSITIHTKSEQLFFNLSAVQDSNLDPETVDLIYFEAMDTLGKRVGEMHKALASVKGNTKFLPEDYSMLSQRSLYQSMRTSIKSTFRLLEKVIDHLDENLKKEASELFGMENKILSFVKEIISARISVQKIRIHGNLNLRQILFTGKDFIIKNFEGPSTTSLSERKLKRSALRDVSGLISSLYLLAHVSVLKYKSITSANIKDLEVFIEEWWLTMSDIFLKSYYEIVSDAAFLPKDIKEYEFLIKLYLLEKMMHELSDGLISPNEEVLIHVKGIKLLCKYIGLKD